MVSISYFHGRYKRRSYFEGWYFKHHGTDGTLACIPGISISSSGLREAFLQIVTDTGIHQVLYPDKEFYASPEKLEVVIGDNYFSSEGMVLNIETNDLVLSGSLAYKDFTPLISDIMGPFRFVPFMQCNHGVESLYHELVGEVEYNGVRMDFGNGQGYCEKDWGSSFPNSYAWTQANDFVSEEKRLHTCVMMSIAHIPFKLFSFQGVICSVLHEGIEYRLATYNGAKILQSSHDALVVGQGPYILEAFPSRSSIPDTRQILRAPREGALSRRIHESVACTVRYRFSKNNEQIFDITSSSAGFEYVNEETIP